MRRLLFCAAAGLSLSSTAAWAQELGEVTHVCEVASPCGGPPETGRAVSIPARIAASAGWTPGGDVVNARRIEETQASDAATALETVPGLSVTRQGAFGGVTTVGIRGAGAGNTLLLLDGIAMNDPSTVAGTADLSLLDLVDIEAVQILSGPQGSLWGSGASGGVVALSSKTPYGPSLRLEGGSYGAARVAASAGWRPGDINASAGVSFAASRADGVSRAASGTEDDGFDMWTLAVRGAADFGRFRQGDYSAAGGLRYTERRADLDGNTGGGFGDTGGRSKARMLSGSAEISREAYGFWDSQTLSVSVLDVTRDEPTTSRLEGRRTNLRLVGTGMSENGMFEPPRLVAGLEREDTEARLASGARADTGVTSAFAVFRDQFDHQLTVMGSLRYDLPDDGDGQWTGRIGGRAQFDLGSRHRVAVLASVGQGFRSPGLAEMACDLCLPGGPSVGLKPERSQGWDVAVEWTPFFLGNLTARVTGYSTETQDRIVFAGRYANVGTALATGIDATTTFRVTDDMIDVSLAYSYVDAVDQATGRRLPRVPEHSGSATISGYAGDWNLALAARYEGEQADIDPSTFAPVARDDYVLVDVRVERELKFIPSGTFYFRVENLADERWQDAYGYGQPGRAAYVGLKVLY